MLVSQAKNMIIVESVATGQRQPAYSHDKVISLGDIAIYTNEGEEPLKNIFTSMKAKENGEKASIDTKSTSEQLRTYFKEILPDFDTDRVYPSDIKKIITWYNLLTEKGLNNFEEEVKEEEEETKE